VLVAGDLFDTDTPTAKTLLEPLERMKRAESAQWHILPGNHDPHRPQGVWDRVRAAGLPPNVRLHLTATPQELGSAVLLPAPLTRKSDVRDLTEWMDTSATPSGAIRIGLAHGSVVGFQSEGEANNPIDPKRPGRAGLDYLALGDWHRTVRIGERVWYAGTPEPDRFGSQQEGKALVVDIAGPGALPVVSEHVTGRYRWRQSEERVDGPEAVQDMETKLRALPDLSCTAMRLTLVGTLPLSTRIQLEHRLMALSAAMLWLDPNLSLLHSQPSEADLERIDFDGVLRAAADELRSQSQDPSRGEEDRKRASEALIELYLLTEEARQ
jgi:DNA repair exonuclease SbcCD nuclease subunit